MNGLKDEVKFRSDLSCAILPETISDIIIVIWKFYDFSPKFARTYSRPISVVSSAYLNIILYRKDNNSFDLITSYAQTECADYLWEKKIRNWLMTVRFRSSWQLVIFSSFNCWQSFCQNCLRLQFLVEIEERHSSPGMLSTKTKRGFDWFIFIELFSKYSKGHSE